MFEPKRHSNLGSDTDRARVLTIGERRQKVRQLDVGAVRGNEPLDIAAPSPSARFTHNLKRRLGDVGQGIRAAGHELRRLDGHSEVRMHTRERKVLENS